MRRLTREDAARERGVSLRTMDRWIKEGIVKVDSFMEGQRRRVMVLLEDDDTSQQDIMGREATEGSQPTGPAVRAEGPLVESTESARLASELAVAQERVRGLEEQLSGMQRLTETMEEQRSGEQARHEERVEGLEQVIETLREQNEAGQKLHEEQVGGLNQLVETLQEQNALERSRYSQFYQDLVNGTLALPEARVERRPWWRFWGRRDA